MSESATIAITSENLPTPIPDADLKGEWLEEFSLARTAITAATSLIAYQMYQCEYTFTFSPGVPTAGALVTNEKNHIFVNPDMWDKRLKSSKERAFILFHEIMHIFLEHQGRQVDMGYDHELWNVATDYYINLVGSGTYRDQNGRIAYAEKYTKFFSRPSWVLYKEKYLGMSSDEIYHSLLEEHNGDAQAAVAANGGGKRIDDDGAEESGGQFPIDSVSPEKPGDRTLSKNRRISASAVVKASKEKTIGENEGGLVMAFQEINTPKISWKERLDTVLISSIKDRTTYNRVSRRSSDDDILFPSHYGDSVRVVWGVDSSGSMSQLDYTDAASETKGLMEQFDHWEIVLMSCDTKAHVLGTFSVDDGNEFEEFDISLIGGGGTNMQPFVDHAYALEAEGEDVNACVIITDGYIPPLDIDPFSPVPVIIVVTSNGNRNLEVEDAMVIHMSEIGK